MERRGNSTCSPMTNCCPSLANGTGREFCAYYGVTEQGNFNGKNILNRLHADPSANAFDACLPRLRAYRRARTRLHLDDKILTAWNGLMIAALANLSRATGRETYLAAARRAQGFIEANLAQDGRLYASFRAGVRSGDGYLDDYAFYAAGLIELYAADGREADLVRAQRVCEAVLERFGDPSGGFYLNGTDGERLVVRPEETYDGALPSGNAVMAYNLVPALTQPHGKTRAGRRRRGGSSTGCRKSRRPIRPVTPCSCSPSLRWTCGPPAALSPSCSPAMRTAPP